MESKTSIPAFRIRNGKYADLDALNGVDSEYRPSTQETFIYSVMKLKNGFAFSQNSKSTGKQSYLFLNIETLSLKQLTGTLGFKRQRGRPTPES